MELIVTPEVEALLRRQLETGCYENPSDLIETALHVHPGRSALREIAEILSSLH